MNIKAAAALSVAGVLLTGTAAAAVNASVLNTAAPSPVGKAASVVPSDDGTSTAIPVETMVVTDTQTAMPEPSEVAEPGDDNSQDPATGSAATHDAGDDHGGNSTVGDDSAEHSTEQHHSGSGSGTSGSGDSSGSSDSSGSGSTPTATSGSHHGGDDSTPEPTEPPEPNDD